MDRNPFLGLMVAAWGVLLYVMLRALADLLIELWPAGAPLIFAAAFIAGALAWFAGLRAALRERG